MGREKKQKIQRKSESEPRGRRFGLAAENEVERRRQREVGI